jgi:EmrB/QacA subfamily drug resistance transporter
MAQTLDRPTTHPRRWWVLVFVGIAQAMLIIDLTVLNVALPTIGAALELDRASLTWVAMAYTLMFGSLLLLGGRLADTLGRRRVFLAGLGVFVAASLGSGLAPDGTTLVITRFAQGLGAALLSPAALSIVTTTFGDSDRTRALAVWAALAGSGAAIGVVIGGVLTSTVGWPWIFFVNVPIGAIVALGVVRLVVDSRPAEPARIDLPGAVLSTLTVGLLLDGVITAGDAGWTSSAALLPIGLAIIAGGAFLWLERRIAMPLVRIDVIVRRPLGAALVTLLAASGLLAPTFFLASLYLQRLQGLSAIETGLVFLPAALAIIAGAHAASTSIGRFGPRPVAAGGLLLTSAGAFLLSRLPAQGDVLIDVLPGLVLSTFGLGLALVASNTAAFLRVTDADAGMTSGALNTTHELGFALGVSLVSTIAGASLASGGGVEGFGAGFAALSLVGIVGAGLAFHLLPGERPALAGRAFAH